MNGIIEELPKEAPPVKLPTVITDHIKSYKRDIVIIEESDRFSRIEFSTLCFIHSVGRSISPWIRWKLGNRRLIICRKFQNCYTLWMARS